jgi:hypothetical protein
MYRATIFLTLALVGGEQSALLRGKSPQYPLNRLGGPQSQSGRHGEEKILDPTETQTPTPQVIQPVASRYTDYAAVA